ncbi:GTP 3',8-cyclase MoaA [Nakamurella leprariae]|uniref:GTP 3',8-cyclase n=1 Tax=Nakamurella leprariae TaxID=2803911 RepID=A0A938Y608_9ACTN|nr:GTP 3',8-cyclase MoaA [Nakamurella leprariae]MBM9466410.1 GTP 3',8-cyclase MoaA [Nakamurella leprariae]
MTSVALGLPSLLRRPPTPADLAARPAVPGLVDRYGRQAHDLRVSLTDRCNLRCTYCMPAEGLDWMPGDELLSDDELLRLIRVAVEQLGVREIRFTGGEPLLRRGLEDLVAGAAALTSRPELSLTTNGIGLARRAERLVAAGLDRINVSLDTLDADTFLRLTRRPRLPDVLAGLRAAADAGLTPVKVNAVLVRDVNDDQAPELLAYCLEQGYQLRFIEQMPLDAGHVWSRQRMITAEEILDRLQARFTLTPHAAPRDGAPAELFDVSDSTGTTLGTVGVIASVTRPFCGDCDRTRLTADGRVRTCLFSRTETDLRELLRSGLDDATLADTWRTAMWGKLPGHDIDDPSFLQPDRPMSAIGG